MHIRNFNLRLSGFIKGSFPIWPHFSYAAALFLALEGGFLAISGRGNSWKFNIPMLAGIATLFIATFYLRCLDEVKDLDYDQKYNPDRPLVNGTVSTGDVYIYAAFTFIMIAAINSFTTSVILGIIIFQMIYAAFLIKLEKNAPSIAENMLFNLIITHPVNILLAVYVLLFTLNHSSLEFEINHVALIIANIFAFLHFEFTRKIAWPEFEIKGEKLYTRIIGTKNAMFLCFIFALLSCTILLFLFTPWEQKGLGFWTSLLPLTMLFPSLSGMASFFKKRKIRLNMTPYGENFLTCFFVSNIIHGLVINDLQLF